MNSAQAILDHILESDEADELVKEVGAQEPFAWLSHWGFHPYRQSKWNFVSWTREFPNQSKIIVAIEGSKVKIHVFNFERELEALEYPFDQEKLQAEVAKLVQIYGGGAPLEENVNNDDFELKDVVSAPFNPEVAIDRMERSLDEIRQHGSKELEEPFELMLHWLHNPGEAKIFGWPWAAFRNKVWSRWIPALRHAGMELQAEDLMNTVEEFGRMRFHE